MGTDKIHPKEYECHLGLQVLLTVVDHWVRDEWYHLGQGWVQAVRIDGPRLLEWGTWITCFAVSSRRDG